MNRLDIKQIKKCFKENKKIDWNDEYEREVWKDKSGPLTLISIFDGIEILTNDGIVKCSFIQYKCSDESCRRCNDETLDLRYHTKIIKPNGLDPFGKVEVKETKKKTIYNIVKQPVFKYSNE